jgi:hypothetical protein
MEFSSDFNDSPHIWAMIFSLLEQVLKDEAIGAISSTKSSKANVDDVHARHNSFTGDPEI